MNKYNPDLYNHVVKISPRYAVTYHKPKFKREITHRIVPIKKKGDRYELNQKSKKSMNNCFDWLRIISNKKIVYSKKENKSFYFELAFITLTLPTIQRHSDDYIKAHLLSPFLKWMQRSWQVNSYIWKAEVQNNGNIHFHITINKFVHWKSIRTKWNRLLSAHGYCKVFQDGSNDKGDAATNIKSVMNPKLISNYVANYCTKKDMNKTEYNEKKGKKVRVSTLPCSTLGHYYVKENHYRITCDDGTYVENKRKVEGRIWNASYHLNVSAAVLWEIHEPYKDLMKLFNDSSICQRLDKDFSKVYIFKKKFFNLLPPDVKRVFKEARAELRKLDEVQQKVFIESFY
jgi:hypothetical protein